ncbi:MAG: hypothetical protein AW10_01852 [Candidatus Accumulibacter appositus]|uniref:Uncharacterized protein n=1 Tax=Candidatus Accumulibacter appositus TaxID=1454003 RepID=A0A011NYF1_9PROT|nr:MAG: hypothetical protein AW10_01852 [Candidatus Accumulibacter appositus]
MTNESRDFFESKSHQPGRELLCRPPGHGKLFEDQA